MQGPPYLHSVCVVCASTSGVAGNGTDSTVNKSVCVCVLRRKPNLVNARFAEIQKERYNLLILNTVLCDMG